MEAISHVQPKIPKDIEKVSSAGVLTSNPGQERDVNLEKSHLEKKRESVKVEESNRAKIERIAEAMDNYVQSIQRELKIQVHNGTGDIMVKVISEEDGKVIREIPPRELLDLAAKMEEMTGLLFNENA